MSIIDIKISHSVPTELNHSVEIEIARLHREAHNLLQMIEHKNREIAAMRSEVDMLVKTAAKLELLVIEAPSEVV